MTTTQTTQTTDYPPIEDHERCPLVWITEGVPHTGTIVDLADHLRQAAYSDIAVEDRAYTVEESTKVSAEGRLYTGQSLRPRRIITSSTGYDADDYATVTVNVEGIEESAYYRVDGRA